MWIWLFFFFLTILMKNRCFQPPLCRKKLVAMATNMWVLKGPVHHTTKQKFLRFSSLLGLHYSTLFKLNLWNSLKQLNSWEFLKTNILLILTVKTLIIDWDLLHFLNFVPRKQIILLNIYAFNLISMVFISFILK